MSSSITQLTQTIESLSLNDQKELYAWLDAHRAKAWDEQIERDSLTGKLDYLVEEARADYRAGRCRPLDDVINDKS
jgi:hypothetical protein